MSKKLKGVLKGLQQFKDSVKDLPASDFKYKSSKSKKTDKDSSSNDTLSKLLSRIDNDPALRERIKSEFKKGKSGLFTKEALQEYKTGKGALFERLNPTTEEISQALSKKKPVRHNKGGLASAAKTKPRGNFPDLTGDGKVTKKDVLRGRGVPGFKKGGSAKKKGLGTKWESKWG